MLLHSVLYYLEGRILLRESFQGESWGLRIRLEGSLKTHDDAYSLPVYRDKGIPPKKGGGSSFTVTKLPSSLEPKGQMPLSLPHSP